MALPSFTFGKVLLGLLSFLVAYVAADGVPPGILEVDMAFPRNETYAPQQRFPIVFAFRNSELAKMLHPFITMEIQDLNDTTTPINHLAQDGLAGANFSSHDPYYEWNYLGFLFSVEGHWKMRWRFGYTLCAGYKRVYHAKDFETTVTIRNGAKEADLNASTTNKSCNALKGVALNITGISETPNESGTDETCVSTYGPAHTTPDACSATVDAGAAESIISSIKTERCNLPSRSWSCGIYTYENWKSAADRLGVAGLVALYGTIFSLLIL